MIIEFCKSCFYGNIYICYNWYITVVFMGWNYANKHDQASKPPLRTFFGGWHHIIGDVHFEDPTDTLRYTNIAIENCP